LKQSILPHVSGGWQTRAVSIGTRSLSLYVPAAMEHLLASEDLSRELPYWAHLWPAAFEMAGALVHAPWTPGTAVLELGSGVGLVGLAALDRGDRVCFSDLSEDALLTCRANALLNGFDRFESRTLDWRDPPAATWPAVIACDVLYDSSLHEPLLNCLEHVLGQDGVAWIGDPGRAASIDFFQSLGERFQVRILTGDAQEALFPSRSQFQIFEVTRMKHKGHEGSHKGHEETFSLVSFVHPLSLCENLLSPST
jgi:predicted nicotinamide N-methyase